VLNNTFFMNVNSPRQIVILQCTDASGVIQWQNYFYGGTPGLQFESEIQRATNARGISVWAGATDEETRIAICGETYDDRLPMSQAPLGWTQPTLPSQPNATGFIAVYNGAGTLLWTHHFFGQLTSDSPGDPDCAITDVSIRTQLVGETLRDIVTYCGISSYGNPGTLLPWLEPVLPFDQWLTGTSDGQTDFGPNQWDGIVGRISRPHLNSYDPQNPMIGLLREFHSIVGGPEQDGLFGIDEWTPDNFFAVGSAAYSGGGAPAVSFPFRKEATGNPPTGSYRLGCLMLFVAPTGASPLDLAAGWALGTDGHPFGATVSSIARDVMVARGSLGGFDVRVVGATEDPGFFGSVFAAATPGHDVLQGPSDGFLLGWDGSFRGVYVGGDGIDGLTGVGLWNEYDDHVQVVGYSEQPDVGFDMLVASWFRDTAANPQNPPFLFVPLRQTTIGGDGEDRPAVMGLMEATSTGLPFVTGLGPVADGVGNPAGGGIGVDPRARVTVVGRTRSSNFQPTIPLAGSAGRALLGSDDAVSTYLDMLPVGVGRTDGTGSLTGTP
jgi:hypothetical protein